MCVCNDIIIKKQICIPADETIKATPNYIQFNINYITDELTKTMQLLHSALKQMKKNMCNYVRARRKSHLPVNSSSHSNPGFRLYSSWEERNIYQ